MACLRTAEQNELGLDKLGVATTVLGSGYLNILWTLLQYIGFMVRTKMEDL